MNRIVAIHRRNRGAIAADTAGLASLMLLLVLALHAPLLL